MSFSNPINIATAPMEQIYERLRWIYSTFGSTFVYDAIGKSYPLSDITQLTRAKIPYQERFDGMIDYKQNEVIQDLQTKDLLCTEEDWISRDRLYYTIHDHRDNEGQELYISMDGVHLPCYYIVSSGSLREPEVIAAKIMIHVK